VGLAVPGLAITTTWGPNSIFAATDYAVYRERIPKFMTGVSIKEQGAIEE
jgi:hypothetical protein